ncbi:ribbon-helix-helix domain-containing protein [Desulfobacterota bacterium AH_259_B03_O07]|nr:ribbon-helix-helix domain-containing protein [Desulfobacterota bacterium AH_259_B03_O07]
MKRTQIYLKEKQHEFLSKESEKKGISIAQYIRDLIDKNMPKEKDWGNNPFWNIGKDGFSTGTKIGSIEHDKVIYKTR